MINQDSDAETWVFCGPQRNERQVDALEKIGVRVWPVTVTPAGQVNLHDVLDVLGREQKNSLLVEGGGRIHGAFLREKLVDQVKLFLAPVFLGADGIALVDELALDRVQDGPRFKINRTRRFGDDVLVEGLFNFTMKKGK
jgi:diaminohydroxyphosphoribosylaminopyrimidine deaminase/5-amino-6-(5-phosphoribosylamino)uracil reductase